MSLIPLQPIMLLGLLSLVIPLIIHLLSKRRFNVVEWGAMQFLQLQKKTKRKIQLEQILLMFLRMAMLAFLVLAFAHLWGKGAFLSQIIPGSQKDIMLVLDSSYSMTALVDGEALFTKAQNTIYTLLHDLPLQDKVGIIDAREQPLLVVEKPILDRAALRKLVSHLPPPTGTTQLTAAIERAIQTLNDSTTLERDIIVLTDFQKIGTELENSLTWQRLDDLLNQLAVKPRIWFYDLSSENDAPIVNYYINDLKLSRETTVPGFPVKVTANIKVFGQIAPGTTRQVFIAINSQRLGDKSTQVRLNTNGEATAEFELRLDEPGEFRIAVQLEEDGLNFDNLSERIIVVKTGLPLLIVDGAPHPDPTLAETYFLKLAYDASHDSSPWVKASLTDLSKLPQVNLQQFQAVLLANTADLPAKIKQDLIQLVEHGGNLIIAPGDRTQANFVDGWLNSGQLNCFPAKLESIHEIPPSASDQETAAPHGSSFVLPWLNKFQEQQGGDLTLTRFTKYWKISPIELAKSVPVKKDNQSPILQDSSIIARFTNQDPWIIQRKIGAGSICMLATPLDADWSTLPSKNDFLPFIHELIFSLTNWKSGRNLLVGEALTLELPYGTEPSTWKIRGPHQSLEFLPQSLKQDEKTFLTHPSAIYAGVYEYYSTNRDPLKKLPSHLFHVASSHTESDLTKLSAEDVKLLTGDSGRLTVVRTFTEISNNWKVKETGTELWRALLLLFLLFLVLEIFITSNMIKRGDETLTSTNTPQINLGA